MLSHSVLTRLGVPNYPKQGFQMGQHRITVQATPLGWRGKRILRWVGRRWWYLTGDRVGIRLTFRADPREHPPAVRYSLRFHRPDGLPSWYYGTAGDLSWSRPEATVDHTAYLAEPGKHRYDVTFTSPNLGSLTDSMIDDSNTRTVADFQVHARDQVTWVATIAIGTVALAAIVNWIFFG